jgi:hypothetical protein
VVEASQHGRYLTLLVDRLLQVIDTDGLRWSGTIPAGGDLVKETDNRLLQNNLQHTFIVQTCKECTP